jgi:hypothetical protein
MREPRGKRWLQDLVAVTEMRHRRKALALQREALDCRTREAALAARREKLGAMAEDIAELRRDYLQRLMGQGAGYELLTSSIDTLLQQRTLEMFRMAEDQAKLAEARARASQAASVLSKEDERLGRHRRALQDVLVVEADRQEEADAD